MLNLRQLFFRLALVALVFALAWPVRHAPAQWTAGLKSAGNFAAARSWYYQLDKIDPAALARAPGDVLVIDYAKRDGKVALTPEEVARIKAGPDGRERIVLAYLSVGESEQYRFYWRDEWKSDPPAWLGEENCAWPKAHRVRFWEQGWKDINFAGPQSYLARIISAGFDGVYLDRVDIYETYLKERPQARSEMVQFVEELARTAWRAKPGFLIVPQNAESLLESPRYRSAIDGVGKESLFHGLSATAKRNRPEEIEWSASLLEKARQEGKPIFVVEYLRDPAHMSVAAREVRSYGFVPTFQSRALDGQDPAIPVKLESEIGTPERTAKDCPPGTSW